MPRNSRIVVPGIPHHVTQRSNKGNDIFFTREDRLFFLEQLKKYAELTGLEVVSYCLMTNHTHLIVIPREKDSLARAFKPLHLIFSQRHNNQTLAKGLNWQGRFYSSPMDEPHAYRAIQYVILNPLRAGICNRIEDYEWSSARAHLGKITSSVLSAEKRWLYIAQQAVSNIKDQELSEESARMISRHTRRNLPIGSDVFVSMLEEKFGRTLRYRQRGRPWS